MAATLNIDKLDLSIDQLMHDANISYAEEMQTAIFFNEQPEGYLRKKIKHVGDLCKSCIFYGWINKKICSA